MSKFKMKLKLQGLEIEIEGARDDFSSIGKNIGAQMGGLLRPSLDIIEHRTPPEDLAATETIDQESRRVRKRKSSSVSANAKNESKSIDFRHDAEAFGYPQQSWKTATKILWLIHVLQSQGMGEQFSAGVLALTFNKHFKQAGSVQTGNVTRDLGNLKMKKTPAPIGEETSKNPTEWYLTTEGKKQAEQLVAEAKDPK